VIFYQQINFYFNKTYKISIRVGVEPCIVPGIIASLLGFKVMLTMTRWLIDLSEKIALTVDFHLNIGWAVGMGVWTPHSM
jgi:hypothetical protein